MYWIPSHRLFEFSLSWLTAMISEYEWPKVEGERKEAKTAVECSRKKGSQTSLTCPTPPRGFHSCIDLCEPVNQWTWSLLYFQVSPAFITMHFLGEEKDFALSNWERVTQPSKSVGSENALLKIKIKMRGRLKE